MSQVLMSESEIFILEESRKREIYPSKAAMRNETAGTAFSVAEANVGEVLSNPNM